jgi:hypothetical protein
VRHEATVKQLGKYLDKFGWLHQSMEESEKEGIIVTGWGGRLLTIDPIAEKHALIFEVPSVVTAPRDATPADRLNGALLAMAALNRRRILGSWGYNPTSGEIAFRLAIPTIDSMSYETFTHLLTVQDIVEGVKTVTDVLRDEGYTTG